MLKEWKRVWEARKWMKKNDGFLPTWHAYMGYKMNFFDRLSGGKTITECQTVMNVDNELLNCWIDVGLVVGHLSRDKKGQIHPSKQMKTYFSQSSGVSIGELLKELMEMHIPTLLSYPSLMKEESNRSTYNHNAYGQTVAETSAMIEKLAFPKVKKWINRLKPETILDIGCGHAGYLRRLSQRFNRKQFSGIDLNKHVIHQAKRMIEELNIENVSVYHQDFLEGPLNEESYDHIMLNNVFHYFSEEKREELIAQTHKYLNDDGTLTIISPLYLAKNGKAFSTAFNSFMTAHHNLYPIPTENEIKSYAERMGFKVIQIKPVVKEGSWYFIGLQKAG